MEIKTAIHKKIAWKFVVYILQLRKDGNGLVDVERVSFN